MSAPQAGDAAPFAFARGGGQGGAETPDQWSAIAQFILEPIVQKWGRLGMGIAFPPEGGGAEFRASRAVWADDVALFWASAGAMQRVIRDLNDAFAAALDAAGNRRVNWKPPP
eukprot:5871233-Pyramimonas_sp.AAC.1